MQDQITLEEIEKLSKKLSTAKSNELQQKFNVEAIKADIKRREQIVQGETTLTGKNADARKTELAGILEKDQPLQALKEDYFKIQFNYECALSDLIYIETKVSLVKAWLYSQSGRI